MKQIDHEIFIHMPMICEECRIEGHDKNGCGPDRCPFWASLEDVGGLRAGILKIINDWEPRESGHVGVGFHLCQELRNLIGEPGCSCDDHNTPAPADPDGGE